MTNKVVTITLNPALDLTGSLDVLNVGSVSLVKQGSLHAAGKGVNVAKVLSDLGAKVTVTGFLGRDNQELFCQLFDQMAAIDEFVRVDGATRINVKLVEQSGEVSDINFPGVEVTPLAIEQFERTLERLAADHDYFVLAGSLPQGISPALCASWIEKLHSMGKKVLFDSSRDALKAGLDAKPWLIKPNDEELSQFVGRELHTPEQCQAAAAQLAEKGIENIVVSMGANGVMWLNQHQWLHAKPPRMQVVSTVGAGDTLVAGLCWGHMQQMEKTELLTFATALSALAVTQVGVGMSNRKQLETLQQQIQLQPVSLSANS
ncbi:1-phosphofructokinase [Vibrio anguillarum]|uniref:Phosphofructokinase n=1 Tax=Vibrio anguillarum TaxID=55601 RepID=A0AAW4B9D6_VIBAN|nr:MULTISPECIES: 1-phosphofructokinase [Vibrio]OXX68772.1 1-phosphofructokinase [Vibrio sp. V03_P4A6T147]AEH35162.1 1-phosphofructokinase [Vibrio anguillarum 775]AGU59683.1 1-phosphofructokinase [Vibrio anguillarum M3]ASF93539.1 1-phosphofructokinase [Vibrio anguillarum]ASG09025.1 1-phosphofructokinase [Vibrio anguillarum]